MPTDIQITEEDRKRIEDNSIKYAITHSGKISFESDIYCVGLKDGFIAGAEYQLQRSQVLVSALKDLIMCKDFQQELKIYEIPYSVMLQAELALEQYRK
jgi:hypothetical protein